MKRQLIITIIVGLGTTLLFAQQTMKASASKMNIHKVVHLNFAVSNAANSSSLVSKNTQLSSVITTGNTTFERMSLNNGTFQRNLLLNNQNVILNELAPSSLMQQQASADTTFYESWETYDGTTLDWIPSNWKEENKTGNQDVAGQPNTTWYARAVGSLATQGSAIEWVETDQTGLSRDEWLISPAFTPKATDYLCFDLYYSPYYMYFDMAAFKSNGIKQFEFSKPTTTMQVMVSTDGGSNWTKLWDAHDLVGKYNDTNIGYYINGTWYSYNMPMASYSGKSVKIAFRYVGKGGDGMGVDNIGVRILKPIANYHRPQGFFYLSFTPKYESLNSEMMIGAAFEKDTWRNQSNQDSKSFNWSFEDPKDAKATINTSEINPVVQYPNGFYTMPTLSATAGVNTNDYKWGGVNSGFLAGGNTAFDWGTLGAGNCYLLNGINNFTFAVDDYVFGTGPKKLVDGICNYFQKPVRKYLLDSLWISLGAFKAPVGTVFNLRIRKVNPVTGDMSTVIAKASCTTDNVKEVAPGLFSMLFKGFVTFDTDLGTEIPKDYLEIEDAILIELYGFNKTGITLGAFCEKPSNTGDSNAYVFYNDYTAGKRVFLSSVQYINRRTSMLFNLGITYPFLHADDSTFVAPTLGGSKTFNVSSYVDPNNWWLNDPLPIWLTSSQIYNAATGAIAYTLTAESLPAYMAGRGATVVVSTIGADMIFEVSQGEYTSISTPQATNTKVISQDETVKLTYSSDFNKVTICTVAGLNIGSYNLSSDGKTTLPVGYLHKGLYLFKFTGKKTETVKVIR
jgi:hypothetical protein